MEQPPNKYANGKIYKIVDTGYNECYYGSTRQPLCSRMSSHRRAYNRYKNGKTCYITSYGLFDKYGLDNCKIELVELYPCGSKAELEMREGHYIKENECINKYVAGRSKKEWCEQNRDIKQKNQKKYADKNRDYYKEKNKEYYDKNKERRQEYTKQYRVNNKDRIKEREKQYRLKKKAEKTDS